MIHYNYNARQLEAEATKLLTQFDPERLTKPKPIDVYAVIEKCLGVEYDWKYITPDQSILGATAFNAGYIWVWPEPCYREGMRPEKAYLSKGCILIDATLTEGENRGRENFTVMHEVFHQVLHKNCFRRERPDYIHSTTQGALNGKRRLITSLDFIEYQANTCAAAFLMPQAVVRDEFKKRSSYLGTMYPLPCDYMVESIICDMASEFSVSKQAMRYRLNALKLITFDFTPEQLKICI